MNVHYKLLAWVSLVVLVLDQASKWLIVQYIPEYRSVTVIPHCFDLVNIRNRGAAFGFLNRSDIEWQFWLFLGATIIAVGSILFLVQSFKEKSTGMILGLGCILGGALGNLIDRIRMRAVIDFLDFYWQDWHWPAFNIADTGICVGAFLVGILLCLKPKAKESN
ncbi:MAG: signal peptidase II [Desulfovibrionaceae bacterium]|nr:signal peptidase II [Desulfovibrionaceae bacterium]